MKSLCFYFILSQFFCLTAFSQNLCGDLFAKFDMSQYLISNRDVLQSQTVTPSLRPKGSKPMFGVLFNQTWKTLSHLFWKNSVLPNWQAFNYYYKNAISQNTIDFIKTCNRGEVTSHFNAMVYQSKFVGGLQIERLSANEIEYMKGNHKVRISNLFLESDIELINKSVRNGFKEFSQLRVTDSNGNIYILDEVSGKRGTILTPLEVRWKYLIEQASKSIAIARIEMTHNHPAETITLSNEVTSTTLTPPLSPKDIVGAQTMAKLFPNIPIRITALIGISKEFASREYFDIIPKP